MPNNLERINEVVAASANVLLRHVVPLFNISRGKRPVLIGTSLLVERGGAHFLVTARHVADRLLEPWGLSYYVATGDIHRVLGSVLHTQPHPDVLPVDRYDVAVIKLALEAQPPGVDVRKLPLPFESLHAFQFPRHSKQYLVTGFPQSRSRANPQNRQLKSEPAGFRLASATTDHYASLGLTEQEHIVLGLDIEKMVFPDGSQRQVADPHGMSGSPLWLLFDEDRPNDRKIALAVGVVIEYHRDKKLLVATDIAVAIHLINESSD